MGLLVGFVPASTYGTWLFSLCEPGQSKLAAQFRPSLPTLPCVHENAAEVRAAVRQQVMNPRMPFYQWMLDFPKHRRLPGVTG